MPLLSIIPSLTFDSAVSYQTTVSANVTSFCFQHAQKRDSLYQPLLILSFFLPSIVWPLLPSTSEVVNHRILAFSSLIQFISIGVWIVYTTTTDTDDTRYFQKAWVPFVGTFLLCCVTLGMIGHAADKSGKRLGRQSFEVPAYFTSGMLLYKTLLLGEYFFDTSSKAFTVVVQFLFTITMALRPGTELIMTTYYHFMTRRISSLRWLPQNGSGAHFNPWWSHSLRFIWVGYTLLLLYLSLVTRYLARECQQELGQSNIAY